MAPLSHFEQNAILSRLQLSGAALAACECGSRNWIPPSDIHILSTVQSTELGLGNNDKAVVAITCAKCGFVKLYDPSVAGVLRDAGYPP